MRGTVFLFMRESILRHLEAALTEQVREGEDALASLKTSLASEAKSTAGDKHETGRAMIQAEMVRLNDTLVRSKDMLERCRVMGNASVGSARAGTLIQTTGPWVFVGLPMGKISLNGEVVLVVGPDAPLALSIQGKGLGDSIQIGPSATFDILHVG